MNKLLALLLLLLLVPALSSGLDLGWALEEGVFQDIAGFKEATDYLSYSGASAYSARFLNKTAGEIPAGGDSRKNDNKFVPKNAAKFSSHTVHFQISRSVCARETFAADYNYEISLAILQYRTGESSPDQR